MWKRLLRTVCLWPMFAGVGFPASADEGIAQLLSAADRPSAVTQLMKLSDEMHPMRWLFHAIQKSLTVPVSCAVRLGDLAVQMQNDAPPNAVGFELNPGERLDELAVLIDEHKASTDLTQEEMFFLLEAFGRGVDGSNNFAESWTHLVGWYGRGSHRWADASFLMNALMANEDPANRIRVDRLKSGVWESRRSHGRSTLVGGVEEDAVGYRVEFGEKLYSGVGQKYYSLIPGFVFALRNGDGELLDVGLSGFEGLRLFRRHIEAAGSDAYLEFMGGGHMTQLQWRQSGGR